ncbi:MAG: HAD family phosphatase [Clostridiales bacterium]|nr:HAD family phosphatase [Clostridiales bacterium]
MKLLFTDLDGTLLNREKKISSENLKAIERASRQGNITIISTGRSLSSARPYIEELASVQEHCYAVTYNGGLIYDCISRKVIYKKTIPLPYVKYIFHQAEKFQIHCQTYEDGYVLAPKDREELQEYASHTSMPVRIVTDPPSVLTKEPFKVLTSCLYDKELHQAYRRSLEEWAKDKISLFFSSEYYLEHVPLGVSKGNAIDILCRILEVPKENTFAAGDAENDIAMLKAAYKGIAMANGTKEVKKAADYVTKSDNEHGGIAEIIKNFIEN